MTARMIRCLVCLGAIHWVGLGVARAAEAPITSVVVFPGSATVERTVQVPAGASLVEISDIPSSFDSKTLSVQAGAGVRVGQITVLETGKQQGVHPREKELQKKSLELQDRIDMLDIDVKSADLVTGYLGRISSSAGEKSQTDGKAVAGVVDSINASAAKVLVRAQQAEIKKREIKEELERVQFELKQVQSGNKVLRGVAVRTLAERPGQIRVAYQVNRAGWQPTYRAMLDSGKSNVDIERMALVSQKTGEDWSGVKLRLSTGQPQAYRDPVDPQTRRLAYVKPVLLEERARVAYAAAPAPASVMAAPKPARENDDAYVAPVIENQGMFATEFEVPGTVTLPADGREVSVTLDKQRVTVTQTVQVTPRVNTIPVLVTEFDRPTGVWLPGAVQLFRDGHYVGATRWTPDASARFSLGFGQDDLLRVSVDRKDQKSGSSGFVGQKAQRKVSDVFKLSNLHREAVEVLVLESAPVSQSEEVVVERDFHPAPSEENWKGRTGVVGWRKRLGLGETWAIDVGYAISYPKEGSVNGLP